jgi:glutamate synthase domain-containing protein 1/glutamate synthase domain-containing protein 3
MSILKSYAEKIIASRSKILNNLSLPYNKIETEGGCGVIGVASSIPIEGRFFFQALKQMKNRGNKKGGGIAAVGLDHEQMKVSKDILNDCYIFQVAVLDENYIDEIEKEIIFENFDVFEKYKIDRINDYRSIDLEVKPPEVYRYFIRVKENKLKKFIEENNLEDYNINKAEDEYVWQTSFILNKKYYSSLGEKKAFVLSCGKNMIVLKIVGYGDDVIRYYKLENFKANVWIGHHRYPTKGKVWHPGGAHPFAAVHHALVHNGDFSNYHPIVEYLSERNYYPLFLTDTEVALLLFDLWYRVYEYDLEYLIEAMAPTSERDFYMLPKDKREIYKEIQVSHITASPDGPWFFIIAGHDPYKKQFQLMGITDTSMLRPQVFALFEDKIKIGIIASERQAINAFLRALYEENIIPTLYADKYWVARGGSHTDGGAFIYVVDYSNNELYCTNKFGQIVKTKETQKHYYEFNGASLTLEKQEFKTRDPLILAKEVISKIKEMSFDELILMIENIKGFLDKLDYIQFLTYLYYLPYNHGNKKRSSINTILMEYLIKEFNLKDERFVYVDFDKRNNLVFKNKILIINAKDFPSEGEDSLARFIVKSYKLGYKRIIVFNTRGQRFIGCGLGPNSQGLRIDVYGDPGDYLASGLDGGEIYVHGSAQDQVAQIIKSGKLVIYGDVGHAFMYGSKGGEVYVLGSAAGRPLINSVGSPKVVINGTCLDYLAESFMAGDPLKGGGFVILNGLTINDEGEIIELEDPYPGSNLFSLSSGGAIYIRDPYNMLDENQLHGGKYVKLSIEDWKLIYPYLKKNEELFGITVDFLLTVKGERRNFDKVYKKVVPK